jgi:hypothetical protein
VRSGVLGSCFVVSSSGVESKKDWEALEWYKDWRLAVKVEEGVKFVISWWELGVVADAIPVMAGEGSDSMRRSLSRANLTKELGFCGIDEVVLLLVRPWP